MLYFGILALLAPALPVPLVDLPLEAGLTNRGSLGGEAALVAHSPGEEAGFEPGPFGACLDLTAARRHGGPPEELTPSGAAVVLPAAGLTADNFTLVLWARQSPAVDGLSARLGRTVDGWDWLPAPRGMGLALGGEKGKVIHHLNLPRDAAPLPPLTAWRCYVVAVDPTTVQGWVGGLDGRLTALSPLPRNGPRPAAWGKLELGTFAGIRPFNGWLARFRVYGEALAESQVAALLAADLADQRPAPPFTAARRPEPPRPALFPRSARPFSTRWQKPEALAVMDSFKATDCLWVYGSKTDYIATVKQTGRRYQGTLNGLQGTAKAFPGKSNAGDPAGRHEDLDGNKNMPSWMVTFKPPHYTGCANHPAFRKLFFDDARQLIEAGVDMLHVDDGAMNASWVGAGVCFCEACRAGFRDYLATHRSAAELQALGVASLDGFDYREHLRAAGIADAATYRQRFNSLPLTPDFVAFQIDSTRRFYDDFRKLLQTWSPERYVPVSVNDHLLRVGAGQLPGYIDRVDFLTGEVYQREFGPNLVLGKAAEALGMTMVASPVPHGTADGNRSLALMYALGQLHLVPWDIYMGSDDRGIAPRYFGTPEEYGPAYDLLAEHPALFDDLGTLAEVGLLVNADHDSWVTVQETAAALAQQQVPFTMLVSATAPMRVALRADDLKPLRLVLTLGPLERLNPADQELLTAARAGGGPKVVQGGGAAVGRLLAARELDVLALEAPPGVYAFPRGGAQTVIHLVNTSERPDGRGPQSYGHVTVGLRHPERWGSLRGATWYAPGRPAVAIDPEVHPDLVRLTVPSLATWGILRLEP